MHFRRKPASPPVARLRFAEHQLSPLVPIIFLLALIAGLPIGTAAQEVRLKLLATGAEEIFGGFAPQQILLNTNAPAELMFAPTNLTAPRYGVITLGPREKPGKFVLVLDEPPAQPARLFIDTAGTGDLRAAPPAAWAAEDGGKAPDGHALTNYEGTATLRVRYDAATCDFGLAFYRFDKSDPRRAEYTNSLLYYADYCRTGAVSLGGSSYAVMLADTGTTGDFRAPTGTNAASGILYLDLNGDGRFARRAEAFPVGKPFNIGGTTYELANMSPSGDSFEIVTSTQSVAESKPLPNLTAGHPVLAFRAANMGGLEISFPGAYDQKLVLLDFWATWCGPCVAEMPNVIAAYDKFHDRGFDILGVSFDRTNAAARVATFTKDHHMPWPQIYEGKYWQTSIGSLYAIDSIPHAFLVDGSTGRILAEGEDLRGEKLEPAIAKALQTTSNAAAAKHP